MTATATSPACPKCQGEMWDNRKDKKNPKAPDYKCRNRSCDGVIWPPRNGARQAPAQWEQEQDASEQAFVHTAKAASHAQLVSEKLNELMAAYDLCFSHALGLATKADAAGVQVELAGISAIAATIYISAKEKGLI